MAERDDMYDDYIPVLAQEEIALLEAVWAAYWMLVTADGNGASLGSAVRHAEDAFKEACDSIAGQSLYRRCVDSSESPRTQYVAHFEGLLRTAQRALWAAGVKEDDA